MTANFRFTLSEQHKFFLIDSFLFFLIGCCENVINKNNSDIQ